MMLFTAKTHPGRLWQLLLESSPWCAFLSILDLLVVNQSPRAVMMCGIFVNSFCAKKKQQSDNMFLGTTE
jgi:hypothetical protein